LQIDPTTGLYSSVSFPVCAVGSKVRKQIIDFLFERKKQQHDRVVQRFSRVA